MKREYVYMYVEIYFHFNIRI